MEQPDGAKQRFLDLLDELAGIEPQTEEKALEEFERAEPVPLPDAFIERVVREIVYAG